MDDDPKGPTRVEWKNDEENASTGGTDLQRSNSLTDYDKKDCDDEYAPLYFIRYCFGEYLIYLLI